MPEPINIEDLHTTVETLKAILGQSIDEAYTKVINEVTIIIELAQHRGEGPKQ